MDLKKLLMMFLVAVLPLGFVACSDDDDDDEPEVTLAEQVVGKWEITHINDTELSKQAVLSLALQALGIELVIDLQEDGTLVVADMEDIKGTYVVSESNATITCNLLGQSVDIKNVKVSQNSLEASISLEGLEMDIISDELKALLSFVDFEGSNTLTAKKK